MARLWDKGLPLDERILRFTAGEDHRLDERLVEYDARASIAHARMLEKQKLLASADCQAICAGLEALAAEHAAGPCIRSPGGARRDRAAGSIDDSSHARCAPPGRP